jgi:hypothetical protein
MLAGQPPFPDGGLGERLFKHLQVEPPDVRDFNRDIPDGLWDVLRRMLAKRPDDRYQTPRNLLEALMSLQEGGSPPPPAQRPAGGAGTPPPPTPESLPVPRRPRSGGPGTPTRVAEMPAQAGLGVSAEQLQVAAGQFERAREVLASDRQEKGYAYELLVSCCRLDPANIGYRTELRQLGQELYQGQRLRRWLSPLTALFNKTRLKAAKHGGDHRKVLVHGEAVLARSPEDATTHLDMAGAAAALKLPHLEVWLLEQARNEVPDHADVLRRLARAYERQKELDRAVKVWEILYKHLPHDAEAPRMINALSARSTIARGKYDS